MSKEEGLNSCNIYQWRWRRIESKRNEISQKTRHKARRNCKSVANNEERKVEENGCKEEWEERQRLEISEKTRHQPKIEDEIVTKTETHKKFQSISTREKNRFRHSDKRRENLEGIGRQCKQVGTNTNRPFSLFQDIAES